MELRNRLIRSATLEGLCGADGQATPVLIDLYRQLAAGGCGLLISGNTHVLEEGKLIATGLGASCDEQLAGLEKLATAVHQEGGKFCLQLGHTGGQGRSKICGRQPLAPSAVKLEQYPEIPHEMDADDIEKVVPPLPPLRPVPNRPVAMPSSYTLRTVIWLIRFCLL